MTEDNGRISVLLVDDSPVFLRYAIRYLQRHANLAIAGTAGDGEAGLAEAQRLRPQVILLDLVMPGPSGLQLIPRLRAALPESHIIVARFLGMPNLFPARVGADGRVETELGVFAAATPHRPKNAIALIRPDRVRVGAKGIAARVEECTFRAGKYRARVVTDSGARLTIETDRAVAMGARVFLEIENVEAIPDDVIAPVIAP